MQHKDSCDSGKFGATQLMSLPAGRPSVRRPKEAHLHHIKPSVKVIFDCEAIYYDDYSALKQCVNDCNYSARKGPVCKMQRHLVLREQTATTNCFDSVVKEASGENNSIVGKKVSEEVESPMCCFL